MKTTFLVLFLDSVTIVEFSHKEKTVYAICKRGKHTRLLGWSPDFQTAKSLILKSFTNVIKIITIRSNIKFNKKLL